MFAVDTFLKNAVEHDRLVMDAVIIHTLVAKVSFMDAFVIPVFAIIHFKTLIG